MWRWLCLAVLLLPLAALPADFGVGLPQAKNAVMILFGLGLILWLVPNPWIVAFVGWTFVSFVASGMRVWGLAGLLGLCAWVLIFNAASRITARQWEWVRRAIVSAAFLQVGWLGLQAVGHDPLFIAQSYQHQARFVQSKTRIEAGCPPGPGLAECEKILLAEGFQPMQPPLVGWFGNPMDLSLFLALSLPAVFALSPWLAVPIAGALIPLRATIGVAGLALVAAWWSWPRMGWRGRVAGVGLLLLGAGWWGWWWDPAGLGGRGPIWWNAWRLILEAPWVGWGPNAIGYRLQVFGVGGEWEFFFNEWLQGAVEIGLPGIGLAAGYLAMLWILTPWRRTGECLPALGVLGIASLVSIPFRIGPVAFLAALYLGRLEGIRREGA